MRLATKGAPGTTKRGFAPVDGNRPIALARVGHFRRDKPSGAAATWQEIAETLARFETRDGFIGPCEMLVGAGTR